MTTIAIEWKQGAPHGRVEIKNGQIAAIKILRGTGQTKGHTFQFRPDGGRLEIRIDGARRQPGGHRTLVNIHNGKESFSFFLLDVNARTPILIPAYGVAVTTGADKRCYVEIEAAITARHLQTDLQRIAAEPEESFANAAEQTRKVKGPTWLGVSRDMRTFSCEFHDFARPQDLIFPGYCGRTVNDVPEVDNKAYWFGFMIGRGIGCTQPITRRLEDGALPILHTTRLDDDVDYHTIQFATLESRPLTAANVRGTDFLVADGYGAGHMFTPEQQAVFDKRVKTELAQDEIVLCMQVTAVNKAAVPRYAFLVTPGQGWQQESMKSTMDAQGLSTFPSGRVGAVHRLNGAPLAQREISVLLQPGATAVFECYIPHRPVSKGRALKLSRFNFAVKHAECRKYWQAKLGRAGRLQLPEKRVDEMARAGLLHLDLITYGREPKDAVCPMIGVYTGIGSESAPIIQFYDSMGWHDVAARSLQFFLEKQHPNGFIQNFGGYMLETGPLLWSLGEHWRYTRDVAWLKKVMPKALKSCEFICDWRARNKRPELRGGGYGMMEGKVGDPEDHFRQFMLNGYACMGLSRVSEMLAKLHPAQSRRLAREAANLRKDVLTAFRTRLAASPVIPLGDGTWCPSCPPWAETTGPVMLHAAPEPVFTHGAITCRDSLVGPLYLAFSELLDPQGLATTWLLNMHAELMTTRNVAFTQPYYSRHDWIHLQRGEVKPFLKTWYNGFSGLADRETYSFWEHYFGASAHKTHEEAWFLMQTRWMLWLESGDTLRLLPGAPRAWLADGQTIALDKVASYFGPFSLRVESNVAQGFIDATIECRTNRAPKSIEIRLPHPHGLKPRQVTGGIYNIDREAVRVDEFKNTAKIRLTF